MGLKVELHHRAVGDLQDIHDYRIKEHGIQAAERVRVELRDAMQRLARRPFRIGRQTAYPEIRVLSLRRYPYHLYYTVTAVAVVILHIRHTARLAPDPGELGH